MTRKIVNPYHIRNPHVDVTKASILATVDSINGQIYIDLCLFQNQHNSVEGKKNLGKQLVTRFVLFIKVVK